MYDFDLETSELVYVGTYDRDESREYTRGLEEQASLDAHSDFMWEFAAYGCTGGPSL